MIYGNYDRDYLRTPEPDDDELNDDDNYESIRLQQEEDIAITDEFHKQRYLNHEP